MLQNFFKHSRGTPIFTAAQLILQTYAVTLIGLAIGIFSARSLSVSDRGSLALLLLISQLLSRLCSLGFEQVILKGGFTRFNPLDFYIASALGTLAGIPLVLAFLFASKLPLTFFIPSIFAVFIISILRINIASIIYNKNIQLLTVLNIGQALLQLVLYIIAFGFHRFEYFFAVWLFNIIVFGFVSLYVVYKREKKFSSNQNSLKIWSEGVSYTGVVIPEMVLAFCLELPFIKQTLGGVQTGLYSISNTVTSIYFQMYYAVSAVLTKKGSSFPRGPLYIVLLLAGFAIWLAARPLISFVFGASYVEAASYLAWMMPVTALLGIVRIMQVTANKQPSSKFQVTVALAFIGSIFLTPLISDDALVIPYIAACYAANSLISLFMIRSMNR